MPARHHILVILAFWVAVSSWFYYRDLRPLFWSETPPFVIDLADEAQAHKIRWTLLEGELPVDQPLDKDKIRGYAETEVDYQEADDTFLVSCTVKRWPTKIQHGEPPLKVKNAYRVTRDGGIREVRAQLTSPVTVPGQGVVDLNGSLEGEIKDGRLTPHVKLDVAGLDQAQAGHDHLHFERDLEPIEVSLRGSVLNPMQPVNRVAKLKKGQQWRTPLLDPLNDALEAVLPAFLRRQARTTRFAGAEVLPDTYLLYWDGRRPAVPCLVIEYTGDDFKARTWVREIDGLVLRQEATKAGQTMTLQRDAS
jgi:hypothetical protein